MANEKLTVPTIRKRLDELLKVVRYSGSIDGETNVCATCRKIFPIKELQCGHFVKRGNEVLKYAPTNLMPQCRRCNHFLDGAQDKAAFYIIKKHGLDVFNNLIQMDFEWLDGNLNRLKREDLVKSYNYWLRRARYEEEKWNKKIIPATWEPTE